MFVYCCMCISLLGYLPRRLYWLWSLHGMTQCQAKIKGSVVYRLNHMILDGGGLWDIRISVTPPATHAGKGLSPSVIDTRPITHCDWPCVPSPTGFSPPFPTYSNFSQLFHTFPHFSTLFPTFPHLFQLFTTFPHFFPLFTTFHHFFPLFPIFPQF